MFIDGFVCLACLRALHFVKSFLSFLAVLFTLSFVFVFAIARLTFALAFVLLASAFVVRARLSTCLVVLQYSVSFISLPPCVRNFETMNSSVELLILVAHHRQIHRHKLCVSSN